MKTRTACTRDRSATALAKVARERGNNPAAGDNRGVICGAQLVPNAKASYYLWLVARARVFSFVHRRCVTDISRHAQRERKRATRRWPVSAFLGDNVTCVTRSFRRMCVCECSASRDAIIYLGSLAAVAFAGSAGLSLRTEWKGI